MPLWIHYIASQLVSLLNEYTIFIFLLLLSISPMYLCISAVVAQQQGKRSAALKTNDEVYDILAKKTTGGWEIFSIT